MALIVYSNGIIEELVSLDKVFTDDELVETFQDYPELKTYIPPVARTES